MKLVVGLGNPGFRYAATRHNLGFRVLDRLDREIGAAAVASPAPAVVRRGRVSVAGVEEEIFLVKPGTFMNQSGRALTGFTVGEPPRSPGPGDILVILDDVYLPFGRLRLRGRGSDGGHNGLRSVLEALGTTSVARLRCGVGPCPIDRDLVEFVLEPFSADEEAALPDFVDQAARAARSCLEEGLAAAMNSYNR